MSHKEPAAAAPGTARPLRALSLPARRNIATNAYTALMSDALEGAGVIVDDVSLAKVFGGVYNIIHIHWPHGYAHGPSNLKTFVRSVLFVAMVRWQKLRRNRLAQTRIFAARLPNPRVLGVKRRLGATHGFHERRLLAFSRAHIIGIDDDAAHRAVLIAARRHLA